MAINVLVKWAAIRYAAVAIVAGGLLVGCVLAIAYLGQRATDDAIDQRQEEINREFIDSRDHTTFDRETMENQIRRRAQQPSQ